MTYPNNGCNPSQLCPESQAPNHAAIASFNLGYQPSYAETNVSISAHEMIEEFRCALSDVGISYRGDIIPEGKIHRFSTKSKKKQNGWYVFYGMAGAFGDWGKGISEKWSVLNHSKRSFSPQEEAKIQEQIKQAEKTAEEERLRKQEETAEEAANLWEHASETGTSEYLTSKQVEAYGVRYSQDKHGCFVAVPLCDIEGKLWNTQKLYPKKTDDANNKWFLPGGRKKGCFHVLGTSLKELTSTDRIWVCEGYSTAASAHMATSETVIMAIDAGNIAPVIEAIKSEYSRLSISIIADNDCWNEDGSLRPENKEISKSFSDSITIIKGSFCTDIKILKQEVADSKTNLIKTIHQEPEKIGVETYNKNIMDSTENYLQSIKKQFRESQEDDVKITPLYSLFHIHTTRELCKYCAASLSSDLMSKFSLDQTLPILFFASSSQQINQEEDTPHRPSGIGKEQSLRKEEMLEGLLNFSKLSPTGIVFQNYV